VGGRVEVVFATTPSIFRSISVAITHKQIMNRPYLFYMCSATF